MDSGEKRTHCCKCQSRLYLYHSYNPPLRTVMEHCTSWLVFREECVRFSMAVFCGYSKTTTRHLVCPAKYTKSGKIALISNDSSWRSCSSAFFCNKVRYKLQTKPVYVWVKRYMGTVEVRYHQSHRTDANISIQMINTKYGCHGLKITLGTIADRRQWK